MLGLFELLFLPVWSRLEKPRYPGTPLAGHSPESPSHSPPPRPAEKIIQSLQIESWSISSLSLLPRCDGSIPPGLLAGKEEINNVLFVF